MAYLDDVYAVVQIQPTGVETFVRLSQNENGRQMYFAIQGGELPSGSTATISGTKPDGVVYSASATISGNTVTVNEDIQLTAVAGAWPAKLRILNGGQVIATGRIRFVIDADPVAPGSVPSDSELEGLVAEAAAYAEAARESAYYGSPLVAATVAGMTDHTRVYVYTGSESGYTNGNWYYWNGSAWTSGGVYNAQGISTDPTLTIAGKAADAKATGDRLTAAENDISDVKSDLDHLIPSTVNVLEPAYIINGLIYGAGSHQINADVCAVTAVYKVDGNKTYNVLSSLARPRFSSACYATAPDIGTVAIDGTYQGYHGQGATQMSITTTADTEYIAIYFYNSLLESVTIEEVIHAMIVTEYVENTTNIVDMDSILTGLIYGASPYDIRTEDGKARIAIYKVNPNTNYLLHSNSVRPRFSMAQYTAKPVVGSTPISGTYVTKHNQSATEISFTTTSTAQYIAAYFYSEWFDTLPLETVVEGLSLTDLDIVVADPPSLEEIIGNIFDLSDSNAKNTNYITARGVIEPSYVLDALIYGASPFDIRSDENCKTAVYRVMPNETYKIKTSSLRVRFAVGCFDDGAIVGKTPSSYYMYSGHSEFEITTGAGTEAIAIFFYNSVVSAETQTAEQALAGITVVGARCESLKDYISSNTSQVDAIEAQQNDVKTEFTFITWNIGHYAMGRHSDTDITAADYVSKLKLFNDLILSCKPDLIALQEYSRVFANLGNNNSVNAEDVVFGEFENKFIGEQKHYSCNAVFGNIHVRGMEQVEYECNRNAVITHTTLIEAQDYYYVRWNMVVNGRDILCIATHLAFDTNYPDVLQQAQIDELISVCSNAPYVMIFGDFNTSNFASFTNAGYTMVNNSGVQGLTGIDNIVCKGLDIVEKYRIASSNTLSDHYLYIGKIKIAIDE